MCNKSNIYVLLSLSFGAGVIKILQTGRFMIPKDSRQAMT